MTDAGLAQHEAERIGIPETPLQQVWRSFRRDRLAMAGLCVLIALILRTAEATFSRDILPMDYYQETTVSACQGSSRSKSSAFTIRVCS